MYGNSRKPKDGNQYSGKIAEKSSDQGLRTPDDVRSYMQHGEEDLTTEAASNCLYQPDATGQKLLSMPGERDSEHDNHGYKMVDKDYDEPMSVCEANEASNSNILEDDDDTNLENRKPTSWGRADGGDAPDNATYPEPQGGSYKYRKME